MKTESGLIVPNKTIDEQISELWKQCEPYLISEHRAYIDEIHREYEKEVEEVRVRYIKLEMEYISNVKKEYESQQRKDNS